MHAKVYAPVDVSRRVDKAETSTNIKESTRKKRLKVQTLENRDNADRESRTSTKRPTAQREDNGDNIDDTNSP